MDRKSITFEQAEGLAPLPSQLRPKELTDELRALLWGAIYNSLKEDISTREYKKPYVKGNWLSILRSKHVFRDHKMIDEFKITAEGHIADLKNIYNLGDFAEVLGFTEWVLRHDKCPRGLGGVIGFALQHARAAYRIIDDDTIVPVATDEEAATLRQAYDDLAASKFKGARTHLKNAASALTNGRPAESVRESIHAVESVARILSPKDKLSDALAELAAKTNMHKGMRTAFTALYGYTSDEQGIRHPLLDDGDAKVDEADALFMIGACASFASYMIAKSRAAGILND